MLMARWFWIWFFWGGTKERGELTVVNDESMSVQIFVRAVLDFMRGHYRAIGSQRCFVNCQ